MRAGKVRDDTGRWNMLQRELERLRPLLTEQGSLVTKRRGRYEYWYLRYVEPVAGGRKQRSVYVGDTDTAQHVQTLLDEIRAPAAYLRETLRLAEVASHLARRLLRRAKRGHT